MRDYFAGFVGDLIVPLLGTPHRSVPQKHGSASRERRRQRREDRAAAEERERTQGEQRQQEQEDLITRTDEQSEFFFDTADDLFGRSQGIDPLFGEVRDDLFGVLENQRQAELGRTGDFFSRRGAGSGTARLNAEARTSGGFDDRQSVLASELGFAGLERSDALREESFDLRSSGINIETIPLQLLISELNARNAGKKPKGGDDSSFFDDIFDFEKFRVGGGVL